MSEKKSENAVVAFLRKIVKPFSVIPRRFNEVRQELKRVIWPTKEKMIQLSAVVLTVIVACAVFLSVIEKGTNWILDQVGFYNQVEETTATTLLTVPSETVAATTAATTAAATTTATSADVTAS
jgi:preprotein translocase subunit SecE